MNPSGYPVETGYPIRTSPDHSAFDRFPELFAVCNVLHRLCTPRHPPHTLSSLITFMDSCHQAHLSLHERERNRCAAGRLKKARPWHRLVIPASIPIHPTYELVRDRLPGPRTKPPGPLSQARHFASPPPARCGPARALPGARGRTPQRARCTLRSDRLEPTGIEPATSALQTRRSPD
jgi:hypothetical protein